MRVFLAGASGVIGTRLVPLLVAQGHQVAGMTRSPAKLERLGTLGAEPVVCDVYDGAALRDAVVAFGPEVVIHQLTDLPDETSRIPEFHGAYDRMLGEGTQNLLAAARAAGAQHFLAQSLAWRLPPDRQPTVDSHERAVLDVAGVVIRYGQFYGPGTYYEGEPPEPPRVHIDEAARRTVPLLDAQSGTVVIVDDVPSACTGPESVA